MFLSLIHICLHKSNNVYAIINSYLTGELPNTKENMDRLLDELGSYSYHSGLFVPD